MSYMTMEEQIASHLAFLVEEDVTIDTLLIDKGFIRCYQVGVSTGRGESCYQTKMTYLNKGLVGLGTWLRKVSGEVKTHKTYGLPRAELVLDKDLKTIECKMDREDPTGKAKYFWDASNQTGEAEYLLKKGVGYYGIRFRQTEYGKIAVIPMRDVWGRFCSYQLINEDGSKRFAKDVEVAGLMHMLHQPINGLSIGLAESYVTAATCFEITGMAMVTAFSSENLRSVGVELRKKFPESPIVIFGDNDRHLIENKGKRLAYSVQEALKVLCRVVLPDFEGYPLDKEFSDWNDYVRINGVKSAREVIYGAMIEDK